MLRLKKCMLNWDLMPATCFKKAGTGKSLPPRCIPLNNILYVFVTINVFSFLLHVGFQLLNSLVSFRFIMWQTFSVDDKSGLHMGQFSTWTFLLQNHTVIIIAECGLTLACWNKQGLHWKRCLLSSIRCSKTCIYCSCAFTNDDPWCSVHWCIPISSQMLAFEL